MDLIVVMKNGNISEKGTYDEIIRNNGAFAEFLKSYSKDVDNTISIEDELDRSKFFKIRR